MPADASNLIAQVDRALGMYNEALRKAKYEDLSGNNFPNSKRHEILNILISTLQRTAPKTSTYWQQYAALAQKRGSGLGPENLASTVGILQALKADLEAGLATQFEEIIHADLFADFLEMAEYLLSANFKDSSAVMIGGVLEEHLRKLADKNGVPTQTGSVYVKADALNNQMGSNGVYNKPDQKSITAWLDLRNKAAHAEYGEYNREQVGAMLMGVRNLISRLPA